ncbi:ATP synthase regulation protein NCA2 [Ophiocordyceps camponoti-floridani]|uniref:ATP synthase regulation protein NCA2 n=1 Tax=Ophiocordyceps camponoti-floridani TaxID=2030778 RepID=A0A8H4Q650_9HYPO|nr:ATP synthase regulation protein NCA2 [Ophiocordyceps camponoti-floridani]
MSIVSDEVRRLDTYLDRLPVRSATASEDEADEDDEHVYAIVDALSCPRLNELLRILRSLSTTSSSQPLLSAKSVRSLLLQSGLPEENHDDAADAPKSVYEIELEWLIVTKATIQVYGVILNTLLDSICPLSDDIRYWSDVLSSYTYSSLYTVQTSPIRLCAWTRDVYLVSKARLEFDVVHSAAAGWGRLYQIVRHSIRERSFTSIQRKVLSPVAYSRAEARRKLVQLRKLRELSASGLGVLMDEGLQIGHEDDKAEPQELKSIVERSVALMDMVLKEVCDLELSTGVFEDRVFAGVEEDPELSVHLEEEEAAPGRPATLARRLLRIMDQTLPEHAAAVQTLVQANGRPSRIVRYWLPAVVGLLSSTTLLRILVKRRAAMIDWVTNLGATVRDFWLNWVVEPTQKVIRTIRHDETSEIAIMSRDSLRADRQSLERMVVDFAVDKPHFAVDGLSISDAQIAEIRNKVAEGDVTPVLRAYEKDLKSPLMGAVRGDLVRSLLIQVQKTKVDLEVAMTGIDSLLRSQELVFGFVGLTPGVLVTIGMFQYLRGLAGGRGGQRRSEAQSRATRLLRNIDRILSEARPTENNVLSYRDHGLLLCEVHELRLLACSLLPRRVHMDFLEDLDDLANIKGVQIQAKALERIRWAYVRWLG